MLNFHNTSRLRCKTSILSIPLATLHTSKQVYSLQLLITSIPLSHLLGSYRAQIISHCERGVESRSLVKAQPTISYAGGFNQNLFLIAGDHIGKPFPRAQ